jgi:uncharacterized protein
MRLLIALALLFAPLVLRAECQGSNLISALPSDQRAALQAAADAAPFAQGNLWQATRNGSTITVVGTYHLDDPRHAPLLELLTPRLTGASALLVEAGPEEEAALQAEVLAHPGRLLLTSGPALPEALGDEDWTRLARALRARAIPPALAARLQPWYVMVMLSIPACQFSQATLARGLDKQLISLAQAQGVPVAALEPWNTLFTIFDTLPREDQLALLGQALDAEAAGDDLAVTLADSYFAGQNRLFWEFSKYDAQTRSGLTRQEVERDFALLDQVMMSGRNAAWISPIEAAAARGPVVVAMGALHLPGDAGVLNLLTQRGWTLTPLLP